MKCKSRKVGSVNILMLSGRFDAYEVTKVQAWLTNLPQQDAEIVLVNLSGVNFIDSMALSTLVQAMKRSREQNGDLYLCSFQQPVKIIFELTRLDKAFTIFETEEMALGTIGTQISQMNTDSEILKI